MAIPIRPLPSDALISRIASSGEPLAPCIPQYKYRFELALLNAEGSIDMLNEGISSLQQAIENKQIYRKDKTMIPRWVYAILDWMGCGAVGKAEKELNRVIGEVFNKALRSPALKDKSPIFLNAINGSYLKNFKEHPLLKEIGKIEAVQEILVKKGVDKPDFYNMLCRIYINPKAPNVDEIRSDFKKQLLWTIGDKYELAQLQMEIPVHAVLNSIYYKFLSSSTNLGWQNGSSMKFFLNALKLIKNLL